MKVSIPSRELGLGVGPDGYHCAFGFLRENVERGGVYVTVDEDDALLRLLYG